MLQADPAGDTVGLGPTNLGVIHSPTPPSDPGKWSFSGEEDDHSGPTASRRLTAVAIPVVELFQ